MSPAIPESVLPPLFARLIGALLPGGIPEERKATCGRCAMLPQAGEEPPPIQFHPATKCCTYTPELSNFHVGRILADQTPQTRWAREVLSGRIARRASVTPLGVYRPPLQSKIYDETVNRQLGAFGRLPQLRCPYYVAAGGGQCGIWAYRDATCSTWFCRYNRGVVGKAFWRGLVALLRTIERALSLWVVAEQRLGAHACEILMFQDNRREVDLPGLLDQVDPEVYRAMWGRFLGKERDFFLEAGALVEGLPYADVVRIGGAEVQLLCDVVRRLHERLLSDALPEQVEPGQATILQIGSRPGHVRVRPMALGYDYIEVPSAVLDAARRFSGRAPAEVLAELLAEGVPMSDEVVRTLLDYQVLVPRELRAEHLLAQ